MQIVNKLKSLFKGVLPTSVFPEIVKRECNVGPINHLPAALPLFGNFFPQIKLWEEIYRDYFGMTVDFSRVQIPFVVLPHNYHLVIVAPFVLANAFKVFCSKGKFHDLYSYSSEVKKLNYWNRDDVIHVRDPKKGMYAIWIPKDFIKAYDYFGHPGNIERERVLLENHVTIYEHFLHFVYLWHTQKTIPTPWMTPVICLGTSVGGDCFPEITLMPLRFGKALTIESFDFYRLRWVFVEKLFPTETERFKKNDSMTLLFSKIK